MHLLVRAETTQSYFGGIPIAGASLEWPCKNGNPLAFLASIHLQSLQEVLELPWLPAHGRLLFFYDVDNQPWGFDPKDRDSWAVIHVNDGRTQVQPPGAIAALPQRFISYREIESYPSWERPEVSALHLSDAEVDMLSDLCDASYGSEAPHQIGGFPNPLQGDEMELECQLVSHGIYCGDSSGRSDPKREGLLSGAASWKLLLQFSSDSELDVMWGDMGRLYFWIREEDARAGRFEGVWVVIQCF